MKTFKNKKNYKKNTKKKSKKNTKKKYKKNYKKNTKKMRGGANGPLSELLHESRARASDAWPLDERKAVRDNWLDTNDYSNMDSVMKIEIDNAKMNDTQKAQVDETYEYSRALLDEKNTERERGTEFYINKKKNDIRLKYFFVINEKGEEIIAEIKSKLVDLRDVDTASDKTIRYPNGYAIQIIYDNPNQQSLERSEPHTMDIIIYLKSNPESKIVLKWLSNTRSAHLSLEDQFNKKIEEITDV